MAKLGLIFVELSLDDKVYKQKLGETLTSSTATAKGIEASWRALGVKSDQYFDQQRLSAQNAYTLIKNSASASQAEIVRAKEAATAKIKALDQEQHGAAMLSIDNLKKHWLAASAAIAGAAMVANKAWSMAGVAADYQERLSSIDALGRKYGQTGTQIVKAMQDASRGLMSMADTANMAASALNLSLTPTQMIEFTRVSEQLTDVIGGTIPDAFNRMTVAAASGRTMTLAQMGIIVDLEQAYKDHAKTMGRHVDSLSDAEKQQIRLNVILDAAKTKTAELGPPVDTVRDKMDRMTATLKDLEMMLGQGIIRGASGAVAAFEYLAAGALGLTMNIFGLAAAYLKYRAAVYSALGMQEKAKANMDAANDAMMSSKAAYEARNALIEQSKERYALMTATLDEVAAAEGRTAKAAIASGEASGKASETAEREAKKRKEAEAKVAQEVIDTWKKIYLSMGDYEEEQDKQREEFLKKYKDASEKTAKDIRDTWRDIFLSMSKYEEEYEKDLAEALKKQKAAADKAAKEKAEAMRDMYSDLRGYEGAYYTSSKKLIEEQAARYKKLGIDEVAVAAWVTQQLRQEDIKRLKSSGDWMDGIELYLLEAEDQTKSSAERMSEFIKTFATESEKAVSDILFQGIKTGSIDAEAIFESFTDTMLRKMTDTIAQMVVEAATKQIVLSFGASWTGQAMSVLGTIGQIVGWGSDWFSGGDTGGVNWEQIGGEGVWAMAKGGHFPSGQPMWVGEEGPELVFPQGSGYVMPHKQSISYAARNGGYIPGYADGGEYGEDQNWVWDILKNVGHPAGPSIYYSRPPTTGEILAASKIKAGEANKYGWTPEYIREYGQPMWFNVWSQHIAPMDAQMSPNLVGVPHPERQGSIMGGMWTDPLVSLTNAVMSYVAPIWGVITGAIKAGAGLYYKDYGMAAGGVLGAAASGYSMYSGNTGLAGAGTDTSGVGMGGAGEMATGFSTAYGLVGMTADLAKRYILKYILSSVFGGGGYGSNMALDINFAGMSGGPDFSSFLSDLSAPSSVSFPVISARNGLDYVPYDGMPAILHKGERVLTKEENSRGGMTVNVHYHGTVIEEKKAARAIAEMIYPETRKLEGWGH